MTIPNLSHLMIGTVVVLTAFDDVPEHLFEVHSVEGDWLNADA